MSEALREEFQSTEDEDCSGSDYPSNSVEEVEEQLSENSAASPTSQWTGRAGRREFPRSPKELWKSFFSSWVVKESLMLLKLALPLVSSALF